MPTVSDEVKPPVAIRHATVVRMDTPSRRWRAFLEQVATDLGDGWQSELARRLGVTPSAIQKHHAGERKKPSEMIDRVVQRMGVSRDFFEDPSLDDPNYKDFRRRPAGSHAQLSGTVQRPGNVHWRRFELLGVAERLGLTSEQVEWVRSAPFRGGPQSVDDYIAAAEMVVRHDLGEPVGVDEARAENVKAGSRIKLGGGS